jgi:hypothetical protein
VAKQSSDTAPPTWSKPNTMAVLSAASASAKPPTMKGTTTGGVPVNTGK